MTAFSWDSPTFGRPGSNVHYSETGSWLPEHLGMREDDES